MNLEELFESIDGDAIEGFVEDKEQENLHLDFKTVVSPELRHADNKKTSPRLYLASPMQTVGYSFGCLCRKNDEGIDCATTLKEIDKVTLLLSKLGNQYRSVG